MEERALHPRRNETEAARTQHDLRTLVETGERLAAAATLDAIVETALAAGCSVAAAQVGACLCRDEGPHISPGSLHAASRGASYRRWVIDASGLRHQAMSKPEVPEALLSELEEFLARAFPRPAADTSSVPGEEAGPAAWSPLLPLLAPHEALGSFLAVPLRDRKGSLLGALLYGHPEADVFTGETKSLVSAIATQAGLAIDHLLLRHAMEQETAKAEAARGEQRATDRRLRQVLEAAQLGTWRWDAASGLIDFDDRAAELFGVPPGVPLSRNELREHIVHPGDLHLAPADLRTILAAHGKYNAEYRVRNAAGEVRWVAANGSAVAEPGQVRVSGMIGTLQDITSRKVQEESLRTSEKLAATGRLAATIAHEINNPLEAVTNLIYLAKTDPVTPLSVSRMLETADTELARVSQIAQQTLGFYRDTSRPVSVDLNDLVQAVVDLFERKLTGKQLRCTLDLEPGLNIIALQGEIRQVVSNLLVNAIDASASAGGRIHIRARRRFRDGDRGVYMLISDQGSGIPHHVRPLLFTPFTTTKQSLGTGLGLWVTQGMVEKHGGSVRFRSRTDLPSGTVFRVYLPESGSPQLFAHQSSTILQ